jgi:hypothetical protein
MLGVVGKDVLGELVESSCGEFLGGCCLGWKSLALLVESLCLLSDILARKRNEIDRKL